MDEEHQQLSSTSRNLFDQVRGDRLKQVLVIDSGSILEQGLARILPLKDGLDVVCLEYRNMASLVEHIASIYPEIIILNRLSFSDLPHLLRFLNGNPATDGMQVMAVGVDSNRIDVYENGLVFELPVKDFYTYLEGGRLH